MNRRPGDPVELLRRANPVPTSDEAGTGRDRAREVLDRVLAAAEAADDDGPAPRWSRHRRPARRLLIPGAAVAAVAAVAAFAWARYDRPDDATQVACHREVDLGSDVVAVLGAADPVAACAAAWREGRFEDAPPVPPPLAACVAGTGIVAVFPAGGGDPCTRLDLPRLDPGRAPDRSADLGTRLSDSFAGRCLTVDTARRTVTSALGSLGLDGWTVEVPDTLPPDRPCAVPAVDAAARTVHLSPAPPPPGGASGP